ncbi:hypothetical protein, partial [Undibacterium luofuense]|uniref:hypothetical protein n=1 Tax=Undibacterium luofuense TaxID=2828733 RepID=UPI0030EDDA24
MPFFFTGVHFRRRTAKGLGVETHSELTIVFLYGLARISKLQQSTIKVRGGDFHETGHVSADLRFDLGASFCTS